MLNLTKPMTLFEVERFAADMKPGGSFLVGHPSLTGTGRSDIVQDIRLVDKNGGTSEPEFRLPPTIVCVHIEHGQPLKNARC